MNRCLMSCFLDAPDNYEDLDSQGQRAHSVGSRPGYDYPFKCDDDTFVYPYRLLQKPSIGRDYCGRHNGAGFMSGGPGYWLSAKAMKIVAKAPDPTRSMG